MNPFDYIAAVQRVLEFHPVTTSRVCELISCILYDFYVFITCTRMNPSCTGCPFFLLRFRLLWHIYRRYCLFRRRVAFQMVTKVESDLFFLTIQVDMKRIVRSWYQVESTKNESSKYRQEWREKAVRYAHCQGSYGVGNNHKRKWPLYFYETICNFSTLCWTLVQLVLTPLHIFLRFKHFLALVALSYSNSGM